MGQKIHASFLCFFLEDTKVVGYHNNNKQTRGIKSQWVPLGKQGLVSTSRHANPLLSGSNASQMRNANANPNSKPTALRALTPLAAAHDSFICPTQVYEACPFPSFKRSAETFWDAVNCSTTCKVHFFPLVCEYWTGSETFLIISCSTDKVPLPVGQLQGWLI